VTSQTATPIPAPLAEPGDLVAGKYRVERVVAIGGMGVVLAARHEDLDQPVAIKLLRREALTNAEAVARFLREARTAARLQGEHIARVFDVGTTDEGVPFMVMELLNGQDLQQVIDARGPLPVRDAVDYVLQSLEAVAEAHAAGVVHRDLKPSNLFLATRPDGSRVIKVLDFGISKGQGLDAPSDGEGLTATKQVMGSPGYMSPEQMTRPRSVDGRTDIWSIGVVLYALLAAEPPFQGETVAAVMASILHEPVPRLRAKRSDVPASLEKVIDRCLQRDLGQRFANVAQLARALASFASTLSRLSVDRIENVLGAASPAGQTLLRRAEQRPDDSGAMAAWSGSTGLPGSRRRVLVGVGATAALAAAMGLGVWLGRGPLPAPAVTTGAPVVTAVGAALATPATPAQPPGAVQQAVTPGTASPATTPESTSAAAAGSASPVATATSAPTTPGAEQRATTHPGASRGVAAKPGGAGGASGATTSAVVTKKPPKSATSDIDRRLLEDRK